MIGAGIGGLTSAIELARRGFEVTVVERTATVGGKMREVVVGDARIDAGPTVFTMRWVFDAIFEDAGAALDDHVTLRPLDVLARHAWSEDQWLDLFADIARSSDAIGAFAGPTQAAGYRAFCAEARRIFGTLRDSFLTSENRGPVGLAMTVGLHRLNALLGLRPFDTLWRALGDHFTDPRLRQLFGRYATYCGSSPFDAPATLMLVAHVEQDGVWSVQGGMHRLAVALERLAISLGVEFRFSSHARSIEASNGRVSAVALDAGERLTADYIVLNADPQALAAGLFGLDQPVGAQEPDGARSLSAVTWAAMAEIAGPPLSRHNVFFSGDYRAEFDDIFTEGRLPRSPTVYVCAQDRLGSDAAPKGHERLLLLINAPATGDRFALHEEELRSCQTRVLEHLQHCGLTVNMRPETTVITTPRDFNTMFPATGGALYGRATHGWAAAFRRPGPGTKIPGLYLAGGGAHPGAGVPMAALSGQLAAQRIQRDHASTNPFRRAATRGGTSTP